MATNVTCFANDRSIHIGKHGVAWMRIGPVVSDERLNAPPLTEKKAMKKAMKAAMKNAAKKKATTKAMKADMKKAAQKK